MGRTVWSDLYSEGTIWPQGGHGLGGSGRTIWQNTQGDFHGLAPASSSGLDSFFPRVSGHICEPNHQDISYHPEIAFSLSLEQVWLTLLCQRESNCSSRSTFNLSALPCALGGDLPGSDSLVSSWVWQGMKGKEGSEVRVFTPWALSSQGNESWQDPSMEDPPPSRRMIVGLVLPTFWQLQTPPISWGLDGISWAPHTYTLLLISLYPPLWK